MIQIGEDEERDFGNWEDRLGERGGRGWVLLYFSIMAAVISSSFLSSDADSPQLRFLHYFRDYKIVYNLLPIF